MGVARVVLRAELVERERDHAGSVSSVHEAFRAAGLQCRDECLDRHSQSGRARDVVEHRQPGVVSRRREERLDDRVGPLAGERQRCHTDLEPFAFRDVIERVATRVVCLIRDHDRVAALPGIRAEHRVDRRRRVRHESEVLRTRADQRSQSIARPFQRFRESMQKESHRVGFHACTPRILLGEDRSRTRAEGPVIEEDQAVLEHPRVSRGAGLSWVLGHGTVGSIRRSAGASTDALSVPRNASSAAICAPSSSSGTRSECPVNGVGAVL